MGASLRTLASAASLTLALGAVVAACAVSTDEHVGSRRDRLNANDKTAYDFFVGKGLKDFQSAAVVGNLDQESGMDPTAVQSGGPGRGIAQWSVGGRWDTANGDNVQDYAQQQGKSPTSLGLQLDFIWYELTTFPSYGLATLKATDNITDAVIAFQNKFEGCGNCAQGQRVTYAKQALAAFGPGGTGIDAGPPCYVDSLDAGGVCISTEECAQKPNHVSTPGFCDGPNDIQCCTGPDEVPDAGPPPPAKDASPPPVTTDDDAGVEEATAPAEDATDDSSGCAIARGTSRGGSPGRTTPIAPAIAGACVALIAVRRLRKRDRRLRN